MTFTRVHINALLSLVVLAVFFGGSIYALHMVVVHAVALGCSVGEVALGIIALMTVNVGAVAWVVKSFASQPSNGGHLPDQNGVYH